MLSTKRILLMIDNREQAEKGTHSHTKWTWSHVGEHRGTYPGFLSHVPKHRMALLCFRGRAGLFLSATCADQGSGSSSVPSEPAVRWVGIGFVLYTAFLSCLRRILVATCLWCYSCHTLCWPRNYFCVPLGTAPLAASLKSSVNELALPFP